MEKIKLTNGKEYSAGELNKLIISFSCTICQNFNYDSSKKCNECLNGDNYITHFKFIGIADEKTVETKKSKMPVCKECGRAADKISEYITMASIEETTPDSIARGDGTYNWKTNQFYCTVCYVKIGCPRGTA